MIETDDTYYDGTRDEVDEAEQAAVEEEDADEAEDTDGDEDYFDLDDDEEPIEDEEAEDDEDQEGEDGEEDAEEEESAEEPEEKPTASNEDGELKEAIKALLKAAGVKNAEDLVGETRRLTAETLGISPEEYARQIEDRAKFEAQMQRDIEAIHEAFPATKKYKSLKELPNKEKFAALMDDKTKNLTAVEAFAASHTDIVKAHSKAPGRNSDLKGTKDHIKSNVPKGAKDTSTYISKGEMEAYREMFPGLSDKEIKKLYKTANN